MRSVVAAFLLGLSGLAFATTPPESYAPPDAEAQASPMDANLGAWLEEHVERVSPETLSPEAFTKLLKEQDPVTRAFLELERATRGGNGAGEKAAFAELARYLDTSSEAERRDFLAHPLLPFALLELITTKGGAPDVQAKAAGMMAQFAAGSCAQKKLVFEGISKEALTILSDEGLRDLVARIDTFRSAAFRRNALKKLIGTLPKGREGAVADRTYALAASVSPAMINQTPWLKSIKEAKDKASPAFAARIRFDEVRKLAVQQQCGKAKDRLSEALAHTKSAETLDIAVTTGKAVDGCYKKRDKAQRRAVWTEIAADMQKAYGFAGWAESRLRLGHLFWSADEFEDAKKSIAEVRDAARKAKSPIYEAKATFALGRIAENELNADEAISQLKDYIERFPNGEDAEQALMGLVLLDIDRKDWAGALVPLEAMIRGQDSLSVDERSVGGHAFALFWAGRVYLEQGNAALAEEMWRRVVTEFYSTYYGAIGHYLLEKAMGKKLALSPARTPTFRMHALREVFVPADRLRVKRVEALMRLGLHEEAVCELEELDVADQKPEKMLLKAVMLFASGRWLDSIKLYDSLPRGFRGSLPAGFERMLFPRRYADKINELAKKASVDPDLVMAIIRQESVFNPEARSPVGALGLMQLMPATAVLEAKRLGADYVSAEERKSLMALAKNPVSLIVPDTNLKIGVHHVKSLLSKYDSPVFMLSAYNASPSAAARWKTSIPTTDLLAFIERIPYKETKAYVKLVLRNYFYYKRWYNPPTGELTHFDQVASPLIAAVMKSVE